MRVRSAGGSSAGGLKGPYRTRIERVVHNIESGLGRSQFRQASESYNMDEGSSTRHRV